MKVYLDEQEVFEITDAEISLLEYEIADVESDIKRRLEWVIKHKLEEVYKVFFEEMLPLLQADSEVASLPKTKEEFINLAVSRPYYKNRVQRDLESV